MKGSLVHRLTGNENTVFTTSRYGIQDQTV